MEAFFFTARALTVLAILSGTISVASCSAEDSKTTSWECYADSNDYCFCNRGKGGGATPKGTCPQNACCMMIGEGTSDEECNCNSDATNPGLGYSSCDDYVAHFPAEPGRRVPKCPP